MRKCSICNAPIEAKDPSVLTMGGYGNPRYVCSDCDRLIEKMLYDKDPAQALSAMKELCEHLSAIGCEDNAVISTVEQLSARAGKRAEAIRAGTYDFSEDEQEESEELVELPEELLETEEDRALDEKEEQIAKRWDKVMNYIWYVMLGLCAATAIYILIKLLI